MKVEGGKRKKGGREGNGREREKAERGGGEQTYLTPSDLP